MKAVCIIASPGAVFDGDVIFMDTKKFGSNIAIYCMAPNSGHCTKAGLQIYVNNGSGSSWPKRAKPKIIALWFWHMVILRKSHVYLTGALK